MQNWGRAICQENHHNASFRALRHRKIRNRFKIVILCSELARENCSEILEKDIFLKREVRNEERGSVCDSTLYRGKVVDVLMRQTEMCPNVENMRLRTAEKESVLHPIKMGFFRTLKGIVRPTLLGVSPNQVFWAEDSPDTSTSFVGFV